MQISDPKDYEHVLNGLRSEIASLKNVELEIGNLRGCHIDVKLLPIVKKGGMGQILTWLLESFLLSHGETPADPSWIIEVGYSKPSDLFFLEIYWRIKRPDGGSLNLPHLVIKRACDAYEIYLPE